MRWVGWGDGVWPRCCPCTWRGNVVDLPALRRLADRRRRMVEDACHALGTTMTFGNVAEQVGDGRHGAMACFSFHPVKTITTGEGGMVTTSDAALATRLKLFRSHGIVRDAAAFEIRPPDARTVGLRDAGAGLQLPLARRALRAGAKPACQARRDSQAGVARSRSNTGVCLPGWRRRFGRSRRRAVATRRCTSSPC